MENSIRAADGRFFKSNQLNDGMRMAWAATFDPTGKSEATRKMFNIEKKFDILHESQNELFQGNDNAINKAAYFITRKTEFINVMSFASAYMMNIPVKDNNGKDSTLWEAFDADGKIKDGWILSEEKSNEKFLFDVKLNIDKLVVKSHGNYWTNMKGKEKFLGRALFQFRSWMPEMFSSR
jgi:hypothetical protein